MNQLMQDVEDLLFEGLTYAEIAESLNISEDEVRSQVNALENMETDTIPVDEWDDAFADMDSFVDDNRFAGEEW